MLTDKKQITKKIRADLKKAFPKCKFSVTRGDYNKITVSLMQAPFEVFSNEYPDKYEISGQDWLYDQMIKETKGAADHGHCGLNEYWIHEGDLSNCVKNNGIFITFDAANLLREVIKIVDSYNYDKSDLMTDYFNVNFYFYLQIGKWDKPFIKK